MAKLIAPIFKNSDHEVFPCMLMVLMIRIRQKMKNDDEDDANATKLQLRNAGDSFE